MEEKRSTSQILFGFLPEQTVDLAGGVWKVKHWRFPNVRTEIDTDSLRREIIRQTSRWRNGGSDGGFSAHIASGAPITVLTLNQQNGVEVEPFPKIWICKRCKRLHRTSDATCHCGSIGVKGQLYFVGFHPECGSIRQPNIPYCPDHKQTKISFPGTATAKEIRFECPVCDRLLQQGFPYTACSCGSGNLTFLPHRASSVYTPRNVVIVNPPSRDRIRSIAEAGGPPKALEWVVTGMKAKSIEEIPTGRESLKRLLASQGLSTENIERMLDASGVENSLKQSDEIRIPEACREEAESQAVTIALAASGTRVSFDDLISSTNDESGLGKLYRSEYKQSLNSCGLESVDLIDRFPVLTGQYGYTRGAPEKLGRLMPFRARGKDGYSIYADITETEALFVRLNPLKIAGWLKLQGYNLQPYSDAPSARLAILSSINIFNESEDERTVAGSLLTLVHSYAHRFMRIAAVYSGIERNALSELLVPLHLGFFVYAAARGDFVLGGLQAVFESELHGLLNSVVFDEHRCALDPGCIDAGGACMACLHVGEPSCRHFNCHLNRATLFGPRGYFRVD